MGGFLEGLWLYQTLIAGIFALAAGVMTVWALLRQIRSQKAQFTETILLREIENRDIQYKRIFVDSQTAAQKLYIICTVCSKYLVHLEGKRRTIESFSTFPSTCILSPDEIFALCVADRDNLAPLRTLVQMMIIFDNTTNITNETLSAFNRLCTNDVELPETSSDVEITKALIGEINNASAKLFNSACAIPLPPSAEAVGQIIRKMGPFQTGKEAEKMQS